MVRQTHHERNQLLAVRPELVEGLKKEDFHRLFERIEICPVSSTIIELAIGLRQQRKMSLGDAIIAATALEFRQTLVTRKVKDFDWVEGLKVVDPIDEL